MFALVLGALRVRTAQTLTLLLLVAIAAAAAAAGPWYGLAAASRSAAADIAAAPAAQRVLSIRGIVPLDGDPDGALAAFSRTVQAILPLRPGDPVLGMSKEMTVARGGGTAALGVASRDDFCVHVRLTGRCPAAAGEVAVSRNDAQELGLDLGDSFMVRELLTTEPVPVRVVARYELTDPTGAYWSNTLFRSRGGLDPVFTPLATFADPRLDKPTLVFEAGVPEALIRGDGGYDLASALRVADARFAAAELRLVNPTGLILDAIARDRDAIRRGVFVALGQVVVLGWFAMGLAGRYTGRDRRGDAALLTLRGNTRSAVVRLTFGQHLPPLLSGVVVGAAVGCLAAWAVAGSVRAGDAPLAVVLTVAAVGAVLAGALLVLAVVDAFMLRAPVAVLLRQIPPHRRNRRAAVADVALLAVTVAAVYEARAGGARNGLGLLAPALVALAVALLSARLLARLGDWAGSVALRSGRLRFGLTVVPMSRQAGSDRVFALIVVAVAILTTAAGGFAAARTARTDRSDVELGATRVLTVQAGTATALQYAVRRADPGGRYAMAVAVDRASNPPVLAVDSARLAAVARWHPEYGPVTALPAAVAAWAPAPLPAITGHRLTLRVRNEGSESVAQLAVLQHESTGVTVPVLFGPIGRGDRTVTAPVSGCDRAPGCRLVRWELLGPPGPDGQLRKPLAGSAVTLRSLAQADPPGVILDADRLTDPRRWHADFTGAALDITAAGGALTLKVDPNVKGFPVVGTSLYVQDTPLPVPVVLAGPAPPAWRFGDPALPAFGPGATPVQVVATASALPVIGAAGVLVDLDAVRQVSADTQPGGAFQVWLAADAPPSTVASLRAAGLTVTGDDSVAARAGGLASQGTAVAARFGLLAGVLGVLLAAATVGVTVAVDRGPQLAQMRALRTQGLFRRAAVIAGYGGPAALTAAGLIGGLLAAVVARPLASTATPAFTDGWRLLPPPAALGGGVLAAAGLAVLVMLGAAVLLSVLPLIRRLRGDGR